LARLFRCRRDRKANSVSDANATVDAGLSSSRGEVGGAFSVVDSLLAVRWAEMVRSRGFRLSFSHNFVEADEALEICQVPKRKPIATVFLGVHWVWVIDGLGKITPHDSLHAALCSLVTLTAEEKRSLVTATPPAWLWNPRPAKPSLIRRLSLSLERLPAVWRRAASGRAGYRHPAPGRPPQEA